MKPKSIDLEDYVRQQVKEWIVDIFGYNKSDDEPDPSEQEQEMEILEVTKNADELIQRSICNLFS